eukprot:SAG31_NODE_4090_length_3600_cov_4.861183_3_plen_188_part_00
MLRFNPTMIIVRLAQNTVLIVFAGGPPLYHISCMYELQPVGPGDGGFGCIAGSHRNAALIGPNKEPPLGAGHVAWGKPPWPPEVASEVTRVEGQPGDAILFTERLVHSTVPWVGHGQRRTLFFKYVGYGLHYTDRRYDNEQPGLSDLQRQVLSYPDLFLNEARNAQSPYFDAAKQLPAWKPLPAARL